MEPRYIMRKTEIRNRKTLLFAVAMLLINSSLSYAQVKVKGSIYGGGEAAPITVNDSVFIHGADYDTIMGSVYGGGEGASASVGGNTYVSITNGKVLTNVYGGGMQGPVQHNVTVEMSGGNIGNYASGSGLENGRVFGGANQADIGGDITLNLYGGSVKFDVFGGNNASGDIHGKITVNVLDTCSSSHLDIERGYLFGGGRNAAYSPDLVNDEKINSPEINFIHGNLSLVNVYGGGDGNTATVTANPVVNHGYNSDMVVSLPANFDSNDAEAIAAKIFGGGRKASVNGNTLVKLSHSGTKAELVYGGGEGNNEAPEEAKVNGNSIVTMTGGLVYDINSTLAGGIMYGGGQDAQVSGYTQVEISGGVVERDVYGGGHGKSALSSSNADLGRVFGNSYVYISNTAWIKGDVFGGGNLGSVTKTAHVNISGGTMGVDEAGQSADIHGNVFGGCLGKPGGMEYLAYGNVDSTEVTVSGDAMIYGSVFGGGDNGHVLRSTVINIMGGTIGKKLTLAEYITDSLEHVAQHIYTGSVIGGGRGVEPDINGDFNDTTGIVFGNTNVTVSDGLVRHGVYGGGGLSPVGTITSRDANGLPIFLAGTGITHVTVTGNALIGPSKNDLTEPTAQEFEDYFGVALNASNKHQYADTAFKYLGGNEGWVFGAGCGLSGNASSTYPYRTFNDSTVVTIDGNANVVGAVYGGGENGHVKRSTNVCIKGGTIGGLPLHEGNYTVEGGLYDKVTVNLNPRDSEIHEDEYGVGHHIFRGDVYGGGKGTDTVTTGVYSHTAGRVFGGTNVTVEGGTIYNRVYGGGSLASVGTYTYYGADLPSDISLRDSIQRISYIAGTGITNVTIKGGTIGSNGLNNGDVVGGSRGLVGNHRNSDTITSTDLADQVVRMAYVAETHVTIDSAAHVKSNVYGGSLNGHVYGDSYVNVKGGTVGDTLLNEGIYIARGGWHGNVYGGGGGTGRYKVAGKPDHLSITSGRVYGNTHVTVSDSAWVLNSVYGGGPIASVGTYDLRNGKYPLVANTGNTEVNVTGGVVGYNNDPKIGDVYGSGLGVVCAHNDYPDSLSYAGTTVINIGKNDFTHTGDTLLIRGSVYGSGENGHVFQETYVTVYSGTIEKNVFGAGSGIDTIAGGIYNPIGGIVLGNTHVNINGGYVKMNVFGGGEMASVGTLNYMGAETEGSGHTTVTVSGGQVGLESVTQEAGQEGNVFGGSLGHVAADSLGCVASTEVIVNNDGYLTNSLFGGGRNSRVLHDAVVNISGGTVGRVLTLAERKVEASVRKVYTGNVYGGGSGSNRDALGNYNASAGIVAGNTEVTISGGTVRHNVYGGGALASVGTWSTDESGAWTVAGGTGIAKVTINGNALIGPKLEDLLSENQAEIDSNFKYLGVNEGHVFGSSRGWVDQECDNMAFTDSTHVTISGNAQVVSGVFGGGANGHVLHGTNVCIAGGTIGGLPLHEGTKNLKDLVPSTSPYYHATHFVNLKPEDSEIAEDATYGTGVRRIARGSVFGGGRGYDTITGSGRYNPVAGRVYGNTRVTVTDGNIYNKVYGGGTLASVGVYNYDATVTDSIVSNTRGGKAEVFIEGGTIGTNGLNNGDVYGGGLGIAAKDRTQPTYLAYVNKTDVQISNGATIKNSVYGGPACGHVLGNTKVTVSGGTIGIQGNGGWHSNVYGGGGGAERYKIAGKPDHLSISAGRVFGNTEVNIEGGTIYHNVYGGGAIASVGKYDLSGSVPTYISDGYTTVNITSGTIGYDGNENGMVFGSARGQIDAAGTFLDSLSYVAYSVVNIGSGTVNPSTGEASSLAGDAVIKGSVYGSGENGHTYLESKVNVFSGIIGCTASEYASMSAYDKEHLFPLRGNVYGAGCGTDTDVHGDYNPQAGVTQGNTFVNIYGGNISHNVYGGGAMARVGIIQNTNKATVELRGGNIGLEAASTTSGFIYGSSRGTNSNFDAELAYCANTEVNIRNGSYFTVFGGGENGQVKYNTKVNVHNGEVQHTIYGGGQGVFGDDGHTWDTVPGRIMGNTEVNLIAGTVNNIYGGSRSSNIWGNVEVNVGTVTQAVDPGDLPTYEGNTTINGNIYGANNKNGAPFGDIDVNIYGTAHVTEQPNADTVPNTPTGGWTPEALIANAAIQKYAIDTVFGGGNHANYAHYELGRGSSGGSQTTVHVYGCQNTICELYGGSNASDIGSPTVTNRNDANVIVDGGRIHRVFGGGNGSVSAANIWGWANTTINAGIIDTVFGGSNMNGSILNTNLVFTHEGTCPEYILDIYGGSNEAPIVGDVTTTLACGEGNYYEFYGGARNANIYGNVTLNVEGGEVENLFGGSCGTVDKPANISKVTEAIHAQYPVYPVNYGGNVTLNLYGGKHTNVFGGSNINGNIEGVITVNVIDKETTNCKLDITNLYGGSKQTAITSTTVDTVSPVVNLIHIAQEPGIRGNVFGGSLGDTATVTSNPRVNIGYDPATMAVFIPKDEHNDPLFTVPEHPHAFVSGNVYGGGSLASTIGNTTVNIYQGVVGNISYSKTSGSADYDTIIHAPNSGMVFGGGKGSTDTIFDGSHNVVVLPENLAKVEGDTRVNIKGGKVLYSVYGGGELSSVTDSAFVTVTGGQVGPAPRVESGYNIPIGLNGVDGYVFGGGKGIGNDSIVTNPSSPYFAPYGKYYKFANVNNTLVTIAMADPVTPEDSITNRLWGSVFGGAEDGHVLGNANVRYESGLMGTMGTTSYDGNIFGGGRNYSKMNYTAGRVGGDIQVEMSGGQLYGSIFGGGRLALTGVNEKGEQAPGAGHGNVKVIVKGGKVGNEKLITDFTKYSMGDVYGGGKGSMDSLNGHPAASALLVSLTRNTEVIVKDSIDGSTLVSRPIIYGTVFGGGEVANVGYFDWDTIINPNTGKPDIANIEFKNTTDGHAKVVVSGGRIGADRMKMRYDLATDGTYNLLHNDDVGHVYGGGEGIVDNPDHYATINPVYPSTATPGIHNNKSLIDLMAIVQSTEVIISDSAWVKGSVYGGAANGHVIGDTWVKIQGGQIGAGDNGTKDLRYTEAQFLSSDSLAECAHWPYGDKDGNFYPYDPVDVANYKYPSDGKTWFGSVYGGGSGYYPYIVSTNTGDSTVWNPESGIVYGNSKVEITGGHILTNVYGGGEVNDILGDSTIVTMSGGTLGVPRKFEQIGRHPVTCYLFGAGKGDPRTRFNTWTNVEGVRVEVSGGWIYGSIFGGGEEGHVHNDVKLIVRGNTGTNEQAIAGTATKIGTLGYSYVDGNVFGGGRGFSGEALTAGTVGGNINVNIRGGQMLGSIYGGGRLASVGTYFANPESPLYGHFKEDEGEHTYGYITVNISGGVIGNDHESTLEHTRGGNVFGGSMGRLTKLNGEYSPIWPFLARAKKTVVNITGGKIKSNVYGGSELGTVRDSAVVIVNGGIVMRDVFAGGYGSDSTDFIHSEIPNHDVMETTPMQTAGRVYGNTRIAIKGGWVQKNVYGGGELASVGTITSYTKHPEPEESTTNSTFNLSWPYEFVYAENTGTATIQVTGGRVGITGKDVMGNVEKEDNGDIYGGGKGIAGDRYVMAHCANVNNTVIHINYTDNTATPNNYTDTLTANRKGCIAGALYGGGENGHVNTDVHVTIDKGLVGHAVYGGGKGKDTYVTTLYHYDPETYAPTTPYDTSIYSITAGKVYGNTYVTINGGYVVRNVFGGGNLASVGKGNYAGGVGDYSTTGYGECVTNAEDWNYVHNSGHAYVTVKGGEIGMLNPSDPEKVFKENVPYGSVFGGCRGVAVPEVPRALTPRYKYCPEDFLGYVNYTHVTIGTEGGSSSDLHLLGSVYGGAQDGHVRWNTTTDINSGEIGVDYNSANAESTVGTADINSKHWTERGNVYGAGSGIGQWTDGSNKSHYSSISGSVTQFDTVNIKGGIIHRNVYGGGNLATVGPPRIKQTNDCPNTLTGVVVNVHSTTGENTSLGYGGYVYGGSRGMATADSTNAYNFEKFAYCPYTTVNLYDGARVYNSVFGGGENGQIGVDHKNAELIHTSCVNVYDGAVVDGSVYGGGQGSWGLAHHLNDTISGRVRGSTLVNLNNSQVKGNIYGGGALGIVMDSAVVVIAGGQVHDVFGAGSGYQTLARRGNADVITATRVNINGGTVHGSVYGGGEFGSVGFLADKDATVTTNVNLNAGHLEQSAYGGGKNGYSRGGTFMNVSGTCVVDENVFGGAYGRTDTVFVAGLRTVNMRGGTVRGSVYGGSYKADDALVFTPRPFNTNDTVESACVVNYSGGMTTKNVFGAGYFGRTYGSTYVFVGTRAIANAPNHTPMVAPYNESYFENHKDLVIGRDIWSGADFGTVEPGSGSTFGGPTITGRSDVYIDGYGYDSENLTSQDDNKFMKIGTSAYKGNVFGCGTLNDGGRRGKIIMIRNYGHDVATTGGSSDPEPWASATRELNSIQHADSLIIDSTHIMLRGQGIVSVLTTTSEPYSVFDIMHSVRFVNGSSLYIDKPIENIGNLYSVVGSNLYDNPTYTPVPYDSLTPNSSLGLGRYDNKIRINQGTRVSVNMAHDDGSGLYFTYGALIGFFHMMTDGEFNAFAYARPKDSDVYGNGVFDEHDNPNDGGFVSYRLDGYNIYSPTGDTIEGPFVQMPYENHTPKQDGTRQGEYYYRVWRYFQSALSVYDVQLIAIASSGDDFTIYQPTRPVLLPPGNKDDYYIVKKTEGMANIHYGSDVKTVNAGAKGSGTTWMYSDKINYNYVASDDSNLLPGKNFMKAHPNNAFGLTMIPEGGFEPIGGVITGDTALICTEANTPLIKSKWQIQQTANRPQFNFRLTHHNNITGNFQWEPIVIPLEHYNKDGQLIGEAEIKVTIVTKTTIEQDNYIDTYALMVHTQTGSGEGGGDHHDVYSAKVLLPTYTPYIGTESVWSVTDVVWKPNTPNYGAGNLLAGEPYDTCVVHSWPTDKYVGMTMYPTVNYDNSNGWLSMEPGVLDLGDIIKGGSNPLSSPITLGTVDPRKPFSLQFDLHYDSKQNIGDVGKDTIGCVEITAHFTNYLEEEGRDVKFKVYVHRRGKGRGFYIDGVNGDFVYSGHYPNAAQPSLAGIFYFTDFEPSDTIYIVNKVTADAVDNLKWDGREYDQVNIFRYNGGHQLYTESITGEYYEGYDVDNNPAYKGVLVDVLTSMSIHSIILDGSYLKPEQKGAPSSSVSTVATNLRSEAPLIHVNNDAHLTILGGDGTYSSLNNNYNAGTDGGAIDLERGSTLNMGQNAIMSGNYIKDGGDELHGGAIFMDDYCYLLLSDSVMINSNYHVRATDTVNENLYINNYTSTISVGTESILDVYEPLKNGSRVGVTKTAWGDNDYMPVVYTESIEHGLNLLSNGSYALGQIIYDDQHQYGLLEYPYRQSNGDNSYLNKLYWAKTWVNQVTSVPDGYNASAIDTPEELAWAISVVNGYNGQTAAPITNFTLTKDIDMSRYIWMPIGDTANNYRGTFDGDGYMVSGIRSALSFPEKGMFGSTNGATIKNLQARVDLFTRGKVDYLGGIVGVMNGGVLSNVESAGYLQGGSNTRGIGGLVGKAVSDTIHSCFALDTIRKATKSTWIGGLVGDNAGDLYNSYSNVILEDAIVADTIGGLVGVNRAGSHVENCYSVVDNVIYSIVYKNEADPGDIKDCYSNSNKYCCNGPAPNGHGTYSEVLDRKDFGYMYKDNLVTLEEGQSAYNDYYSLDTSYVNNHIYYWPGLLSTLNKWVSRSATAASLTDVAPWYRPTTEKINNDLPVLAFKMDSAIAVVDDIAFLRYSKDFDFLLDTTNKQDVQSSMFLYGIATEVEHVPDAEVKVFLNEDAVLIQQAGSADFNNTTTGITFDNSFRKAKDSFQNTLTYDWHLMSSPLRNAKMGINYTDEAQNYWYVGDDGQIDPDLGVMNSYMPNRIDTIKVVNTDTVKWDYYTYYEPEYHWINFKRNSLSHHHYDYPYAFIEYNNEDTLVPAKGYMMAISEDSYLSNTGTLNRGKVTIPVTAKAPTDQPGQAASYNKGSNLVGNPYQAYLDLDKVASANVYEYDDGSGRKDTLQYYYIYSAEEGVYAPYTATVSRNPRIPSRYLHPHQGFFVLFQPADTNRKSMDMIITQEMAGTIKNSDSYFRGDDDQVNYPLVNLIAQNESGERDLAIVELGRPTLGGVEKVENLQNSDFKLYTHLGDKNYSLLFTPIGTQKVPLFFKTPEDGNYTLTWDTHNGTCRKMLLVDNITGSEYNMLTGNSYSFTSHASDYAARFYIVFELDNPIDIDTDDDFAFFDGTQWVIKGEGQLELIDVTGRVLHSYSMNSRHNHVSFDHVAAGTYLLRLVKDRNNVKTQKIVIY